MSALSIASATINSTGNVATIAISGATLPLSFSGTPGGVYVRFTEGGLVYDAAIVSYTISGSNVIANLNCTISNTATALNASSYSGSTLTDAASSTPPTNTVTITNSSTQTPTNLPFNAANVGLRAFYKFVSGSPNQLRFGDTGSVIVSSIDFVVNLSAANMTINLAGMDGSPTSAGNFQVVVDNGSPVVIPNLTTQFEPQFMGQLFKTTDALASGNHTISIQCLANNNTGVNTDLFLQVFGGTATLSQPLSGTAGAPSFWATQYPAAAFNQYSLTTSASAASSNITFECGTSTVADVAQGWLLSTEYASPQGSGTGGGSGIGASFGFNLTAKPTSLRLYTGSNSADCQLTLRVDNVEVGQPFRTSTTSGAFLDLTSYLSTVSAGAHNYHVSVVASNLFIGSILAAGATMGTPPAQRPLFITWGDSIAESYGCIEQYGPSPVWFLHSWGYLVANHFGYAMLNQGIGGTTCHYFNGVGQTANPSAGEFRTSTITNCNHIPTYVLDNYVINDARQQGIAQNIALTTTSASITAGTVSVLVNNTTNFVTNNFYDIDIGGTYASYPGTNYERVQLTVVDSTHLSGTFTKNHSSGVVIIDSETQAQFQVSYFNMVQAFLSGVPTIKVISMGGLPTSDGGLAVTSGGSTNYIVGSANIAAWNARKIAAMQTSGSGNGKGDNTTYLTSGQAARISYIDPVPLAMNGTTNPTYDVNGGAPVDYNTNYLPVPGDHIHPNGTTGNQIQATSFISAMNGVVPETILGLQSMTGIQSITF